MTDTYRVVAPYVMVKVRTVNGVEVKGLYASSLLPEGTLPESIDQHLRKKFQGRPMIEKVGGDPAPAPPPAPVEVAPPALVPEPAALAPEPVSGPAVIAPPTTGPGSGKSAWVEYAVGLSYGRADVEAMSRDEIIALTEGGSNGG